MAKSKSPVAPATQAQMAWLIENERHEFLTVDKHGALRWTTDADIALRFARKQDGEMLASCNGDLNTLVGWRKVVEHAWEPKGE